MLDLDFGAGDVCRPLLCDPSGVGDRRVARRLADCAALGAGTLPTDRLLFVAFLIGVIVIVGGLTFVPALSLGPAAEQLTMRSNHLY